MKIFAQLEKAQLENTTSDTGSLPKGMITYRTDLNIAKVSNGTSMLALIDESSTQTLSGKTYATPNFTGAFNMAQAATPSNPSSGNNKFYFKADGKLYTLDSSGNEALVGSGSGGVKNLITNGSADDTAASIFTAYADAVATRPVAGTGGSPTVTTSITTTTPLDGTKAFLLTKTAANSQGQGWSVPFTVDPAYRAKSLKISVDYIVNSGTFVAGGAGVESDVIWYIYDVTNSQLIEPSNIKMFSNNSSLSDKFEATLQSSATGSSYRLIAHVQSVSALAYELKVDNITVSPQTYVFGTPVTDWQSYTPTFNGFGTPTSISMWWRRIGGNIELQGKFVAGTSTAAEGRVSLPTGILIADTTRYPTVQAVGHWWSGDPGVAAGGVLATAGLSYVTFGSGNSGNTAYGSVNASTNLTNGAGLQFGFFASVAIQGWASSTQMSDSSDTRICAARYNTAAGQSIATGTTAIVDFGTKTSDTHGAVTTGASWKFTAPVAGRYAIKASIRMSSSTTTGGTFLYLYKNGSSVSYSVVTQNQSVNGVLAQPQLNDSIDLIAGDYIDFRVAHANAGSLTIHNDASVNFVNIERISGPSAIAANEKIRVYGAPGSGQSISNGTNTTLTLSATADSHGMVASNQITVPASGTFYIKAEVSYSANTTGTRQVFIERSTGGGAFSAISLDTWPAASSGPTQVQSDIMIDLLAGDKIQFVAWQNSGAALSINASTTQNRFFLYRIG